MRGPGRGSLSSRLCAVRPKLTSKPFPLLPPLLVLAVCIFLANCLHNPKSESELSLAFRQSLRKMLARRCFATSADWAQLKPYFENAAAASSLADMDAALWVCFFVPISSPRFLRWAGDEWTWSAQSTWHPITHDPYVAPPPPGRTYCRDAVQEIINFLAGTRPTPKEALESGVFDRPGFPYVTGSVQSRAIVHHSGPTLL